MFDHWEYEFRRFSLPGDPVPREHQCVSCEGNWHKDQLVRCEDCGGTGDKRIDRDYEADEREGA